jgi:hypothetical protein
VIVLGFLVMVLREFVLFFVFMGVLVVISGINWVNMGYFVVLILHFQVLLGMVFCGVYTRWCCGKSSILVNGWGFVFW